MANIKIDWLKRGRCGPNVIPLLKIEGLTVKVGMRRVLDNLDLEVFEGDHVLITGPNGCGKSTFFNAVMDIPPAKRIRGKIEFKGKDITGVPTHERANLGISYMRQTENIFPGLSVADNLRLALGEDGPERFQREFSPWIEEFVLGKRAGALSGGQKKKLAWGMVVLKPDTDIHLLDEPTAGVANMLKIPKADSYLMISHE
ncbi:MAG: ATP-binding cassette domain-containing protein [Xanthomonadaceae bacterium]|nr:ATP-binding cassette domain-containing protein [Xanthomonadaceae bacterium]